jgi:hypothetical protein
MSLKSSNWERKFQLQNEQTVDVPYDSHNGPITYSIDLLNKNSFKVSAYLFRLGRRYDIQQLHENHTLPFYPFGKRFLYDSREARVGLGISDPKLQETYDEFVVVVCKQPLTSPHFFEQPGFPHSGHHYPENERGAKIEDPDINSTDLGVFRFRIRCYRTDDDESI